MGIEQKLGIRVFYYYLSKRISAGFLLFVFSIILSFFKDTLVSKIALLFPLNLSVSIVSYIDTILFVVSILLVLSAFLKSWLDYISCTFTLDDASFNIKRGIFNKREVSIPYRQIQDIDIEQTFYNKLIGVSKLVILTAGNDDKNKEGESEGIFNVIDYNIAQKMRNDILARTNIQTVREMKS